MPFFLARKLRCQSTHIFFYCKKSIKALLTNPNISMFSHEIFFYIIKLHSIYPKIVLLIFIFYMKYILISTHFESNYSRNFTLFFFCWNCEYGDVINYFRNVEGYLSGINLNER